MKRKILVFAIVLALSISLVGCQTASKSESGSSSSRTSDRSEGAVQTDTQANSSKDSNTATDTNVSKDESLSSDDIKEIEKKDDTDSEKEDSDIDSEDNKKNSPDPSSIQVGGITLEAELIPFESSLEVEDMEDIDSAVFGDTVYILDNKTLHTYTVTDGSIIKGNDIKLNSKYQRVDADVFGNIYLSTERFNIAALNDDGTITELDLTGKLALSKVMNFGLISSGKDTVKKFSDSETEEWNLGNIKDDENSPFTKISDIEFVGNHILVGGNFDDGNENQRVAVYDYDGNQLALTDNKILGSGIDSMTETGSGIVVSSGSNLSLWTMDGLEIGQTKSSETTELFGTENPVWINDVFAFNDGSVLALCSTEAESGKTQALMYKLWGF